MTDDLSALPEDVREALHRINRNFHISADYETILAYMLRLARENDEWQTRCLRFQTERHKARAELAALKARIAGSCPAHAVVDDREECGVRIWVDRSVGTNRTRLGELEGKRVRLVVED